MIAKPMPHVFVFMVGRIVLDEEHLLSMGLSGNLFEKSPIRLGVEDGVPPVEESGRENIDTAEDLDGFSLSGDRDQRLMASAGPCRMERRILSEGDFVFEN